MTLGRPPARSDPRIEEPTNACIGCKTLERGFDTSDPRSVHHGRDYGSVNTRPAARVRALVDIVEAL